MTNQAPIIEADNQIDELIERIALAKYPVAQPKHTDSPPSKDDILTGQVETARLPMKMRETHHLAARLIAEGVRQEEVSLITGYKPTVISRLVDDPAFRELVTFYKGEVHKEYLGVHARLAEVGGLSLTLIKERLLAEMEKIDAGAAPQIGMQTLREIMESAFDRSVAPAKGGRQAASVTGTAPNGVQINITFAGEPEANAEGKPMIDITPSAEN